MDQLSKNILVASAWWEGNGDLDCPEIADMLMAVRGNGLVQLCVKAENKYMDDEEMENIIISLSYILEAANIAGEEFQIKCRGASQFLCVITISLVQQSILLQIN